MYASMYNMYWFVRITIEDLCFHAYQEPLEQAMKDYPEASCVLVRRHGIYVWAESWQRAKVM